MPEWSSLVQDWAIFGDTWLAAMVMAALLGQLGVAVVARGRLTLAVAASQSAMAGCAACLWAGWPALAPMAGMGAAGAAMVAGDRGRDGTLPMTLWLAAMAASLLIVSHSPHGMEEVHRITASSLIGTSRADLVGVALLAVAVAAAVFSGGGLLCVVLIDREHGLACGLPVRTCEGAVTVVLAIAIGWCLSLGGELYTAGMLILPTVAARPLVRTVGALLWVAPLLALLVAGVGCAIADLADLPPAQVIIMGMAVLCGGTALVGQVRNGWLDRSRRRGTWVRRVRAGCIRGA